jgi:hypothetical protein
MQHDSDAEPTITLDFAPGAAAEDNDGGSLGLKLRPGDLLQEVTDLRRIAEERRGSMTARSGRHQPSCSANCRADRDPQRPHSNPARCLFSRAGLLVFMLRDDRRGLLAVLNTRLADALHVSSRDAVHLATIAIEDDPAAFDGVAVGADGLRGSVLVGDHELAHGVLLSSR